MDNVCHTLVGAALGEAGLKRRTRYANVTLMVAANLPDLDVLVFLTNAPAISFRRGWTHGILAQALLPVTLAAVAWLVGKWRIGRGSQGDGPPLHFGWLLALSYAGVYSHVFLDFLNNYGVRLLAPLDWRWFYGDAVFIIDPWLWLALGAGIWVGRRRATPAPAVAALTFAACYIAVMLLSARAARDVVADVWRETRGTEPREVMVGPVPVTPFARVVIVDAGDRYETGMFTWWTSGVTFDPEPIAKRADDPAVPLAVEQSRDIREFLVWARFPFWVVEKGPAGTDVTVADVRFAGAPTSAGARFIARTRLTSAGASTSPGSSRRTDP